MSSDASLHESRATYLNNRCQCSAENRDVLVIIWNESEEARVSIHGLTEPMEMTLGARVFRFLLLFRLFHPNINGLPYLYIH